MKKISNKSVPTLLQLLCFIRTYAKNVPAIISFITFFAISTCLTCFDVSAQDNKEEVKFAENVSIGEGRGVFNYTIPLFTLNSQGVELPISLAYRGDGLKVREEASSVGEGWQLIAGGQIVRQQNGLPDEINIEHEVNSNLPYEEDSEMRPWRVGYLNSVNIDEFDIDENDNVYEYSENGEEVQQSSESSSNYESFTNLKSALIVLGRLDFQPDYFESSVPGLYSGGFYLKRGTSNLPQGSITWNERVVDMYMNIAELKSNFSNWGIRGFDLTSRLDGNTYGFQHPLPVAVEDANHDGYPIHGSTNHRYSNYAWQLTSIENSNNELLYNINYESIGQSSYTIGTRDRIVQKNFMCYQEADGISPRRSNCNEEEIRIWRPRIKRIDYSAGYVEFTYSETSRADISSFSGIHHKLEKIEKFDLDENLIEEIVLSYEYGGDAESLSQRLFLSGIDHRLGSNQELNKLYQFKYFSEYELPAKNSFRTDLWGYYNGTNNQGMTNSDLLLTRPTPPDQCVSPNDRIRSDKYNMRLMNTNGYGEPNHIFARQGMLKEITTSSKQILEVDYEQNEYSYIRGSGTCSDDSHIEFTHGLYESKIYDFTKFINSNNHQWEYSQFRTVGNPVTKSQWVKITYIKNSGCSNSVQLNENGNNYYTLSIESSNGEGVWFYLEENQSISFEISPNCSASGSNSIPPQIKIERKIHVDENPDSYRAKTGGLRTKSITQKNNNGTTLIKKFHYDEFGSNGLKSSGVIFEQPNRIYISGESRRDLENGTVRGGDVHRNTYSSATQQSLRNNGILYFNISEELIGTEVGINAYTEDVSAIDETGLVRKHYKIGTISSNAVNFPYSPTKVNYSRELLLDKVEMYKAGAESPFRIHNYEYEYNQKNESDHIIGRQDVPHLFHIQENFSQLVLTNKAFYYEVFPEFTRLISENQFEKINGIDNLVLVNEKKYNYVEGIDYPLLVRSVVQIDNEKTTKREFKYVQDYAVSDLPGDDQCLSIKQMQESGMTSQIVESATFVKNPTDSDASYRLTNSVINFFEGQDEEVVPSTSFSNKTYEIAWSNLNYVTHTWEQGPDSWNSMTPSSPLSIPVSQNLEIQPDVLGSLLSSSGNSSYHCNPHCSNQTLQIRFRGHAGSTGTTIIFELSNGQASDIKFVPSGDYFIEARMLKGANCTNGPIPDQCPFSVSIKFNVGTPTSITLTTNPKVAVLEKTDIETPLSGYQMSTVYGSFFSYESQYFTKDIAMKERNSINDVIEIQDKHGIYTSTLKCENTGRTHAQVSKGRRSASRYTSFEDDYHGGWEPKPEGLVDLSSGPPLHLTDCPSYAPSGNKIYHLHENSFNCISGGTEFLPNSKYHLSFWSSGYFWPLENFSNINVINASSAVFGEWKYYEYEFEWANPEDESAMLVTMGGDGYIDELRLHEIDAVMETTGYYPDGKQMYEGSAGHDIVTYEYDSKGRLQWLLDRERNVLEYHKYEVKDPENIESYHKHILFSARRKGLGKQDFLVANPQSTDISKSITYSDGFGRFRQQIDLAVDYVSTRRKIIFKDYDELGRETKKYKSYYKVLPAGLEEYSSDPVSECLTYHGGGVGFSLTDPSEMTDAPYVETVRERSPLQRVLEVGGIGEEFQPENDGHTSTYEYSWNTAEEAVRKWTYNPSTGVVNGNDVYAPNTLRKVISTNPEGNRSVTFTDARGLNVANGVYAKLEEDGSIGNFYGNTENQTLLLAYEVYDDFGRVVCEIPAKATLQMHAAELTVLDPANPGDIFNENIHYILYDKYSRVVERIAAGQGSTEYVYDQYDRVVMSRSAGQKSDNLWAYVKFDSRGRAVLNGITTSNQSRQYHQDEVDSCDDAFVVMSDDSDPGSLFGYTNQCHPLVNEESVLSVHYYDRYNFDLEGFLFIPFDDNNSPMQVTRGMATGSLTRVMDPSGALGDMLATVSYYDNEDRLIQAYTRNHLGGYDRIDTYYNDFSQVSNTKQYHYYDDESTELMFNLRYTYNAHTRRLSGTYGKIGDDPEVLISAKNFRYDGQLTEKLLHKPQGVSNFLQRIRYRYNAQMQLTHINNPMLIPDFYNTRDDQVFGQSIAYHEHDEQNFYHITEGVHTGLHFAPKWDGNISMVLWGTKAPEDDGAEVDMHGYSFRYDDLNNLKSATYAKDQVSDPGHFEIDVNRYNESMTYGVGGNILSLRRRDNIGVQVMDDMAYSYHNDGYKLKSVNDLGEQEASSFKKHFVDGSSWDTQYLYDDYGRMAKDRNRKVDVHYNMIDRPRRFTHGTSAGDGSTLPFVEFTYDAAGNKLRKSVNAPCPLPPIACRAPIEIETDYVGNFIYENGELAMIYHPEGVIRPTPENAENQTVYVYDYFIKDYLGNVRVVLTEEDATFTQKWLATMEDVYTEIEENNFDNLDDTREGLPAGYPVDGSVDFNEKVALVIAENDLTMGPARLMKVTKDERVKADVKYFYTEDAPGTTYNSFQFFLNEVLIGLASSAAGVAPLSENQLISVMNGEGHVGPQLSEFLATQLDTTDMSRPHAYLVYLLYDNNLSLVTESSGAKRVENPNQLERLLTEEILIQKDGFLHVYVSNGSTDKGVHFDNFLITKMKGKTRQINHYYPYGLRIAGLDGHTHDYKNMYTAKELQSGEFHLPYSTGLEMYDFHARFYDPQLGRWFTPDPAMQFSNPYLGIGNNPVMYVDPDGEFVFIFPNIGFSRDGGFSFGLNVVVGIPGVASAQAGIGYSPSTNDAYAYVGATAAMNTVSLSYSTTGDFSAGYSVGATPFSGLPISTNLFSAGVNYNITQDSWSGNVSSWQVDQNGWRFNPSVSAMIMPEHTTNFVRKGRFISNDKMLARFVDAGNYQGALDYFGFDGKFNPEKAQGNPGATGVTSGNIYYSEGAFESYDRLYATADQEYFHRRSVRSGKYDQYNGDVPGDVVGLEEHAAHLYNYKRQGLYRNSGYSWVERIKQYGTQGGLYGPSITPNGYSVTTFNPQPWHFIYRIPRLF